MTDMIDKKKTVYNTRLAISKVGLVADEEDLKWRS